METVILDIIGDRIPTNGILLHTISIDCNTVDVWDARDGRIVVHFYYTNDLSDVIYNADIRIGILKDPCIYTEMFVHRGFMHVLNILRPRLDAFLETVYVRDLYMCGFSLGGALATLYGFLRIIQCAADIRIDVLSFGTPVSIGDARFNTALNNSKGLTVRNLIFCEDPVTYLIERVAGVPYERNEKIVVYLNPIAPLFDNKRRLLQISPDSNNRYIDLLAIIANLLVIHRRDLYITSIRKFVSCHQSVWTS
jgi:hypothetical protein